MARLASDENLDQELLLSQQQEFEDRKELLKNALSILNEREAYILKARRLWKSQTLEELSSKFKISRERVRQLKLKLWKLQKSMINASKSYPFPYQLNKDFQLK